MLGRAYLLYSILEATRNEAMGHTPQSTIEDRCISGLLMITLLDKVEQDVKHWAVTEACKVQTKFLTDPGSQTARLFRGWSGPAAGFLPRPKR